MSFPQASQPASAASISLASLKNVNGGVFVKKAGGIREVNGVNGMDITQGDSVRTDQEGAANLIFSTGSKMTIGPNTLFTVARLKETGTSGLKVYIRLEAGTLWNNVKSLVNKEDEYEIATSGGTVQVRGTQLAVLVDPFTGQTMSALLEGSAMMTQPVTQGDSLPSPQFLNPGYIGTMTGSLYQPSSGIPSSLFLLPSSSYEPLPPTVNAGSSTPGEQLPPPPPPPPPPPQPIDMPSFVQGQSPFVLANMAGDLVNRQIEQQQYYEALMAAYQNTNNQIYLHAALQLSQGNTDFADLTQQFMGAVQDSGQEQRTNQYLEQLNSSRLLALRQKAQQLQEQAEQDKRDAENAAHRAGLIQDQIQQLLNAARTSQTPQPLPPPNIASPYPTDNEADPVPGNIPVPVQSPGQTDRIQLTGISNITGDVRVGETLTAGAVTPENATVTYQWQITASKNEPYEDIEGEIENQYIIKEDDVSKFIRVVVTGTGNYAGTVVSNPTEAVAEPIPIGWLLEPTVSFNTEGDTPQIIMEYTANQRGVVHYIVTDENFEIEDDQALIELMTSDWEENDYIILGGSEECSSEIPEGLELPYSERIHSDITYKLYMVLEGVDNTYSEVERITFTTPNDVIPPALTASVDYNEETSELMINHFVKDYDEFYDLYVWVIPKKDAPAGEPTAQEVKEAGKAIQNAYLSQQSRVEDVEMVSIPYYQPATEYIIYLVAQDHSDTGENNEGLYSEVKIISVTTPSSNEE